MKGPTIKETIKNLKGSTDLIVIGEALKEVLRDYPRAIENLDVFELTFDLVNSIEDARPREELLMALLKGMPSTGPFTPLYTRGIEASIAAADALSAHNHRLTELLRLAKKMPATDEFEALRVWAWRLSLGLPDKPRFEEPSLKKIASELPKSKDYAFYRGYTLLGVAAQLPTHPPFTELYREAIALALEACAHVSEPYYQRYALNFIAGELKDRPGFEDLYFKAFEDSYKAALETKDDFAREHAFVDILGDIPVTPPFYDLILEILTRALAFFTMRRWMGDLEVTDVVDFILSAEELTLRDSKKRTYAREKYAKRLASILEKRGKGLNDLRFIDVLRPYAHVWIKPAVLREAVKATLTHIERLKKTFHGREITRPVLLGGVSRISEKTLSGGLGEGAAAGCVAIDLGASNTLVMKKRPGRSPEFISIDNVSINYGNAAIVPTIISRGTDTIGAEVVDEDPVVNIKQMVLEKKEGAEAQMERFLRVLYSHIKDSVGRPGWLKRFSSDKGDVLYITVPIGFTSYKNTLDEISRKVFKGLDVKFIEEPLAAAVGYQVAGESDSVIMMIDFGGCTLDCMILRLSVDGVHVIAKPERAQVLGGHDIDRWIAELLAERAGLTGNISRALLLKAEELKIALSDAESVPFNWNGQKVTDITRYDLEEALGAHDFYRLVDRTINYVLRRAENVGLPKKSIDSVIMTGGSSLIPSFKDKVCDIFQDLRSKNLVFDHSPLTAVGEGAALYGTRAVMDRHLAMAYAVRYATGSKDNPFSYSIVMEKGESLPVSRTFSIKPAEMLGEQSEILLELFEVPEALVVRRWVEENGVELLKQKITDTRELFLNGLKAVKLTLPAAGHEACKLDLLVDEGGALTVKWADSGEALSTGLRLQ